MRGRGLSMRSERSHTCVSEGLPGPGMLLPALLALLMLVLSACSQGSAVATAGATPSAATAKPATPAGGSSAALRAITYDPTTPAGVIQEGRDIFVRSLRPLHPIKWEESIMLFPTDQSMVNWVADVVVKAGLDPGEGEKVLRYFLGVRHGVGAPPCE